jgi:hypothetical protein
MLKYSTACRRYYSQPPIPPMAIALRRHIHHTYLSASKTRHPSAASIDTVLEQNLGLVHKDIEATLHRWTNQL